MSWQSNNKRLPFLHYGHVGQCGRSTAILFGWGSCIHDLVPRPWSGNQTRAKCEGQTKQQSQADPMKVSSVVTLFHCHACAWVLISLMSQSPTAECTTWPQSRLVLWNLWCTRLIIEARIVDEAHKRSKWQQARWLSIINGMSPHGVNSYRRTSCCKYSVLAVWGEYHPQAPHLKDSQCNSIVTKTLSSWVLYIFNFL